MSINPAFIQWKGTDVCMDVYCTCGGSYHVHGDFAYFVKCPSCEQIMQMDHFINVTPVDQAKGHTPITGSDFADN